MLIDKSGLGFHGAIHVSTIADSIKRRNRSPVGLSGTGTVALTVVQGITGMQSENLGHDLAGCLARMEAIVAQATAAIGHDDPAKLDELRLLRLKMASAITSYQMALDRIATDADSTAGEIAVARTSSPYWKALGTEFRRFTQENQSTTAQGWQEYAATARQFMQRIRHGIATERRILK